MNKLEEQSILSRFQSSYAKFPVGEIEQIDKPDFVVHGSKKIGIEITQIFQDQESPKGSVIRKTETFQRLLLEDTIEILRKRNFQICLIDIGLNLGELSKSVKPRTIAEICAKEICKLVPPKADSKNSTLTIQNFGQMPNLVDDINIWFSNSLKDFEYVESSGGVGMTLTNEKLQFLLNKKEKVLQSYEKCDEYWLVIKEGSSIADYFPKIEIDKSTIQTSFNKVFLIRQFGSEVIKLNL